MHHSRDVHMAHKGVRPITWEDFHGICKALAVAASTLQPEIILPIGRGGYYPGTLLAHLLQTEIYPVRLSRRVNDIVEYESPQWIVEPPTVGCSSSTRYPTPAKRYSW